METKMTCSSMILSEENSNSKTKAVASITVNDEFVIKGIKMYENSKGELDILMPSRRFGNDYQDVVFPITADAREQMKQAVQSVSKISTSINLYHGNDESKKNVKAVGQFVIDDCIVVSGVTVRHGTNKDGIEHDFVSMPSFRLQSETGEFTYNEYAHAITKDCYTKITNSVLSAYETLQKTEYKGVKLSELGKKDDISTKYDMNSQFAEKLMNELDRLGYAYSAKVVGAKTAISIKTVDKSAVDKIEKDLSAVLVAQNKPDAQKQKPEPKQDAKKKTH